MRNIVLEIKKAVDDFNKSVPGIQKELLKEIELLVKDLDVSRGTVIQSAKNLRTISRIKNKLNRLVNSPEYRKQVKEFTQSFDRITALANLYFRGIENSFTPTAVLKELQKQSIQATITSLTQAGINANVIEPVQEILRINVTSGAKFSDLTGQLRTYLTNSPAGLGALEKYTKQITTDALSQYSRQYTQLATDDLGLEWFQYIGVEIETSRAFCRAMLDKKYFHKSEIPKLIKGDFPEFKAEDGTLNPKTKLPEGMKKETNVSNFLTLLGGWNCQHVYAPVHASVVPEALRERMKQRN